MKNPRLIETEIEQATLRLRALRKRGALSTQPDYMALLEVYEKWRAEIMQELSTQKLDEYEQGRRHGVLEVLQTICVSNENLAKEIERATNHIESLRNQRDVYDSRNYRQEPPSPVPTSPLPNQVRNADMRAVFTGG